MEDVANDQLYWDRVPARVQLVEGEGIRSYLIVPLIVEGEAISVIDLGQHVAQAFASDEIALVETFAAQAVITIENVRQFRELQARLEREAATRDILQVISRNRDDDRPVFGVIAESAARLGMIDASAMRRPSIPLTLSPLPRPRRHLDPSGRCLRRARRSLLSPEHGPPTLPESFPLPRA